jgi:hypothetical protein
MLTQINRFVQSSISFSEEYPADAVRAVKHFCFDWPNHLNLLPGNLSKLHHVFVFTDQVLELRDLFQALQDFALSFDKMYEHLSILEAIEGRNETVSALIDLSTEALVVFSIFAKEVIADCTPYVEMAEILAAAGYVFRDLQQMYLLLSETGSAKEQNQVQLELLKVSADLGRNLVYLTGYALQIAYKESMIMSCGSVYCAAKIALLVTQKKN